MSDIRESHIQWWDKTIKEDEVHKRLIESFERIFLDQDYVNQDNLRHLKAYTKRNYGMDEGVVRPTGAQDTIGLNLTRSVVDSICAQLGTSDIRPMFTTVEGMWEDRRKARKLQTFVDGLFYEGSVNDKERRVRKDAATFGTGFMKVYLDGGRVCYDRVYPGQIVVDETACINDAPRCIYQWSWVPIDVLRTTYKKKASLIDAFASGQYRYINNKTVYQVRVVESWHLPSGKGAKDGRHSIAIKGVTLSDEEWKHDFFPIEEWRWNHLQVGYYGSGAAESSGPIQAEIDYLMNKTQKAAHLTSKAWLFVHESDPIPDEHFESEDGTIIRWGGQYKPELTVHPGIHAQLIDHMHWMWPIGHENEGVSQLSATGRKPQDIESVAALRTLSDIENKRFIDLHRTRERFFLGLARKSIMIFREAHKNDEVSSDYSVKVSHGNFAKTIKWSEVDLSEDCYVMKCWPSNLLPATPAGKIDTINSLLQSGMIDPQTGMMLLDFPDLDAVQSLRLANLKNILWIVDSVVYEQKYIEPRQFHDLELGIRHMQMAASRAQTEGAPEEVLDLCVRWMSEAKDILDLQNAPDQGTVPGQAPIPGMPDQPQVPGLPPGVGPQPLPGMEPPMEMPMGDMAMPPEGGQF